MKKVILTAALAFTVGVLSLLNTTTNSVKTASATHTVKIALNDRNILATAD